MTIVGVMMWVKQDVVRPLIADHFFLPHVLQTDYGQATQPIASLQKVQSSTFTLRGQFQNFLLKLVLHVLKDLW